MNNEIIELPYYLQCFELNPWFVDPPQGPLLGLNCSVNTTQTGSRRGFDRVTDAIYLKSRFLKDVSNKITSFAVSKRCRNRSEIVAKRVFGFKYSEEGGQDLREEKYLQKSHAAKTLGTGPQALPWPYIRIQINHIQRVRIQMNHIQRVMQNISRSGDTCPRTTPHRARHGGGYKTSQNPLVTGSTVWENI